MSKLMVIAGEASGDLHGGNVLLELKKILPDLELFGTGGKLIAEAGAKLFYRVEDLAVIGFVEVLKKYGYYKAIFNEMVALLDSNRPDAVFLVDYAGFNLRFAAEAKRRGIPVIFYVAPQVWAWKKNRIHKMKAFIDHQIVLFPFEVDYFRERGMETHCFGHPLLEIARPSQSREKTLKQWGLDPTKRTIALLPGSRKNEILKHLALLVQVADELRRRDPSLQFVYPLAPTIQPEDVRGYLAGGKATITLAEHDTYNVVAASDFAIVASGTATLETAILQTPLLIFYKVAATTYWIGKNILKIGDVGLPNIIAGKRIVPELVQHLSSPKAMADVVLFTLNDPVNYNQMKQSLLALREKLGETGAYKNTALFVASKLSTLTNSRPTLPAPDSL